MYKSLFSRLTINLFLFLFVIAFIIIVTLNTIVTEEPKRQFSEKLLRYMILEMGTPPSVNKLRNFVDKLGVSLTVTGENSYFWSSEEVAPNLAEIEKEVSPETSFDFVRMGALGQVVLLRQNSFNYYILNFHPDLSKKAKISLGLGFLALIFIFFLNYRFILWLFSPIKQLREDALKISEGDLEHHIHTNRNDELGELTQSVNAMAQKLRDNISNKRELLLAISHELRTPLARAKMHLSLMPENEYQKKLDANLNELNNLIEALLQSESLDGSIGALHISEVNLSLLIQDVINNYETTRIKVQQPKTACILEADKLRLRLLISNLINNALQYTKGAIEVELCHSDSHLQLRVCDHGEGIPAEDIPKLTEAFYRPDKSRQRKTGSHGLGLYLCQKIVDAHKGNLKFESKKGEGTCVTIILSSKKQNYT